MRNNCKAGKKVAVTLKVQRQQAACDKKQNGSGRRSAAQLCIVFILINRVKYSVARLKAYDFPSPPPCLNSISFGLLLFSRCIMKFTRSSSIRYNRFAKARTINASDLPIRPTKKRRTSEKLLICWTDNALLLLLLLLRKMLRDEKSNCSLSFLCVFLSSCLYSGAAAWLRVRYTESLLFWLQPWHLVPSSADSLAAIWSASL